ncbi:hypothetical protein ACOIXT_004432 [Vibrio parahaemolyticus]|nr:hypothetical protein [Vibrio parahaemolyticus]EME0129370.1 hypothetical protein [Vibrio parahaemolyticus]
MQFKTFILPFLSLLMACYSLPSHAFKVDKMIVVGDQKGNGIITLTNDQNVPLFINTELDEINIENGTKINKTRYSRENIADWKISLTYQKLVLNPGEAKDIGIRSLCHNTTCDNSQDIMFMLSFIPSKYQEGEKGKSGVEINYGFAPVYIIPTTQPTFDYDIINHGKTLEVKNRSNTMINIFVDSCDTQVTKQCRQKFTVLAGRNKTFNLLDTIQRDQLNIIVNSHDGHYTQADMVKRSK